MAYSLDSQQKVWILSKFGFRNKSKIWDFMRHAKATHWLEDGMNIVQISFLLGHSSVETTMVYLDMTTEQEMAALATIDGEKNQKVSAKWNPQKDTLSDLCGLRKLKT